MGVINVKNVLLLIADIKLKIIKNLISNLTSNQNFSDKHNVSILFSVELDLQRNRK